MNWTYDQSDPGLMLFTASVKRFGLSLPPEARVLELGCAETDFLERLRVFNADLDLTGVDVRRDRDANGWKFIQGDASIRTLFEPESFDAIILLGALEHFGLGYYGDPINRIGDLQTLQNVATWLKPGGWVYFDVPCNPEFYVTANQHFRVYSPSAVTARLIDPSGLTERARGYSEPEPIAGEWCQEPTVHKSPYHYIAVYADKA